VSHAAAELIHVPSGDLSDAVPSLVDAERGSAGAP
jgi:hypothetical protein